MVSVVEKIYNDLQDSWIEEFIMLIQVEVRAYKNLLNKLEVQKCAIIDRDILQITEWNDDTEQFLDQAHRASLDRYQKIREISTKIRPSKELNSIEQVIPICKQQYAARLQELRANLLDTLQRIKSTNQVNQYLLNKSLDFVNKNIEIINREVGRNDTYNQTGKIGKDGYPRLSRTI